MRMYDIIMKKETAESFRKKRSTFLSRAIPVERFLIIRYLR